MSYDMMYEKLKVKLLFLLNNKFHLLFHEQLVVCINKNGSIIFSITFTIVCNYKVTNKLVFIKIGHTPHKNATPGHGMSEGGVFTPFQWVKFKKTKRRGYMNPRPLARTKRLP
jgi:hypothetical protein